MSAAVEFYFDFSSPYAYLAAREIDDLAGRFDRKVAWRPFLLGVLFRTTGMRPLLHIPVKGDYAVHDLARTARLKGWPFRVPEPFPFPAVAASRAFYWMEARDEAAARAFARKVFDKAFGEGIDMGPAEAVIATAAEVGADREALAAALQDPAVKERLKAETARAEARGVFGAPYLLVEGEPFWGYDSLPTLERWLATGGW